MIGTSATVGKLYMKLTSVKSDVYVCCASMSVNWFSSSSTCLPLCGTVLYYLQPAHLMVTNLGLPRYNAEKPLLHEEHKVTVCTVAQGIQGLWAGWLSRKS